MVEYLYVPGMVFVDWRQFLLCIAMPWPIPSAHDLIDAWNALVVSDGTLGKKTVSKDIFMATKIWLDRPPEQETTGFDRNHELKEVLIILKVYIARYVVRPLEWYVPHGDHNLKVHS